MLSGKMYRFRVSNINFEARYLEKYLLSQEAQAAIDVMKTGGNDSGLNLTHDRFKPLQIPVPPLNEQRRLASKIDELFSRIEEGERALERVQKLVERYRQSVLKAAVTGELTREWRETHKDQLESGEALLARILKARRTSWEHSELVKMKAKGQSPLDNRWRDRYKQPSLEEESELPTLPRGWVWVSLSMLCSEDGTNGVSVKGSNTPPGVAALRLDAMLQSGFDYKARRYIPISDSKASRLEIAEGDFFISRANGTLKLVGRGVLANRPPERVVFPDTMIRYRPLNITGLGAWLASLWPSALIRMQIEKKAKTTAGIYKISQEDLRTIGIPLAPLEEQKMITSMMVEGTVQADRALSETLSSRRSAGALRQAILKTAFAGQLVFQDPGDEPAAFLLERIASERATAKQSPVPKTTREKKAKA